jgi:hypothetical protein
MVGEMGCVHVTLLSNFFNELQRRVPMGDKHICTDLGLKSRVPVYCDGGPALGRIAEG